MLSVLTKSRTMSTTFQLKDAHKVIVPLQDGISITFSERGKKIFGRETPTRHFRLTRLDALTVGVYHRDFTGDLYEFSLNVIDGKATLKKPILPGSVYEEAVVKILWKSLLEIQALSFGNAGNGR